MREANQREPPLTHVVAILEVVEVAAKEVFLFVKPHLSQLVDTLTLTLLQSDQLVDHGLSRQTQL